jgi:hypothetical protein
MRTAPVGHAADADATVDAEADADASVLADADADALAADAAALGVVTESAGTALTEVGAVDVAS